MAHTQKWKIRNGTKNATGVRHYLINGMEIGRAPNAMAPLAIAPLAIAPLAIAPLAKESNAMAPNAMASVNANAIQFQFTRHATSCYNIKTYEEGGLIRERIGFIGHTLSDGIPSLAHSGIMSTIDLARKHKGSPRFEMPVEGVCVSNLIRTWMTAVLLYAFSGNTITLRMCPYLREDGMEGNTAHPLESSLPKFIAFLEQIKLLPDYSALKEVVLLIEKRTKGVMTWDEIHLPITKDSPIENDPRFCDIADPLHDSFLKKSYANTGDLTEFMKWFHASPHEQKDQKNVHVVAHNHIMQHYVRDTCKEYTLKGKPFTIKTHYLDGDNIDPLVRGQPLSIQNCWSFTTTYKNPNVHQLIKSMQTGYLNPGKGSALALEQKSEKALGKGSLCLQQIAPIQCKKKGGSRTRRNRKTHRRSRRR